MSNTPEINELLTKIGLTKKNQPLAELRSHGIQGKSYDLSLSISPKSAAKIVEKKLGVKADYYQEDGSQYWNFSIPNEWDFYFEDYRSGSKYMNATDIKKENIKSGVRKT